MRKLLNPHQKARIALASVKGDKTFAELASEYQLHPSQISHWKATLGKQAYVIFAPDGKTKEAERIAKLQQMIRQREAEIQWLKKISKR